MNIKSKKGFALAMAICFMIVCLISSVALYTASYFITKEVVVQEASSTRGYYIALSGLRFADIILKNPATVTTPPTPNFVFPITPTVHDGETSTINILNTSGFGQDIHLGDNNVLSITATEWKSGVTDDDFPDWADGEYKVTAVFGA